VIIRLWTLRNFLRRVKSLLLGELRYTSRSFYTVEVKILGGGYYNPSLCNLLPLAKWEKIYLPWQDCGYPAATFCNAW
jgi:hypothetical protein